MIKVVIIGGGWGGCAAALSAAQAGATVLLLERTDLLLGTGLVGGIFRNNGRFTAAEEIISLGGQDLIATMDQSARHTNIEFPGHRHASLYDVGKIEAAVSELLQQHGIKVRLKTRITDVLRLGKLVRHIVTDNGEIIEGDVFIDATGTAGPMGNCLTYGNGCSMCALRCPAFGPRVSITARAQVKERNGEKLDGTFGAMSGSCKLHKESLSSALQDQLESTGVVVIPMPEMLKNKISLGKKACSQYALPEYRDNLVLLDTGHAKMMTSYFALEDLRQIPGLENARFADPYAGGKGNSIRYLGIAPCANTLQVDGVDNLFCCGEKFGIMVGHTEAVATGLLAGHNAVRYSLDMQYLQLPRTLAIGEFIAFVHEQMNEKQHLDVRYTFAGATFFNRMQELNLYSIDPSVIKARVAEAGLSDIFSQRLV
ncbi:FAD-dependent oxidoreductase [Anaerosporomusa subterranea]|uniref:FAD-dependent oxidoreductase n=1 Tax=Anaerosporomusa subterranea TaxID=1794912 RepID=A0A154BUD1_ANASB|nr:FAD-dependent oxidoreductase [Anaerosporomusa subterranea]KYZ77475.1 FAD-dependent oxidoreductase [Anaerosporomusa subterranea]